MNNFIQMGIQDYFTGPLGKFCYMEQIFDLINCSNNLTHANSLAEDFKH